MASTTITISSEAYKLLKDAARGDSFSDVIVCIFDLTRQTAGELLDWLEQIDRELMAKVPIGRRRIGLSFGNRAMLLDATFLIDLSTKFVIKTALPRPVPQLYG